MCVRTVLHNSRTFHILQHSTGSHHSSDAVYCRGGGCININISAVDNDEVYDYLRLYSAMSM